MSYREAYESWLSNPYFDEDTKEELQSIANDEKEIEDRFYMDLEFGTAGLRGVIGAGTNRMNVYTVRKATQGLANYIIKVGAQAKGVAIAYDSRRMSPEFANEAALCLAANGIKAYMFREPSSDSGAVLCSPLPGMYSRNQCDCKPQSTGIQWLQSILGGRCTDHTATRRRHHGRSKGCDRLCNDKDDVQRGRSGSRSV